jgi:mono/diheme cytochrome c family protein
MINPTSKLSQYLKLERLNSCLKGPNGDIEPDKHGGRSMKSRKIHGSVRNVDARGQIAVIPVKVRAPLIALVLAMFFFLAPTMLVATKDAGAASAATDDPGESTFKSSCTMCHGQDGSGNTAIGKSMKIPDLHSREVQSQSDEELTNVISNGKNNMPPFKGSLTEDQIHGLVAHVRHLSQKQ